MGTIVASGIGKYYKRYRNRWWRLAEWLEPGVARHQKHWVLRDIDFAVSAGESVGIIGQNGAGKSTLLKIITGTTQPSTGSVQISGRVAALLELGMGFHPEFTGRQNSLMSGQLLGFSNAEIAACMGEIEAFAEIGDYIDQPVRTYSSGMQVRLAFAVATAIRPDVLIVDEALSVGDIYFQQKCFDRIQKYAEAGTTLLFVTHSMGTVISLCDRAIFLKDGHICLDGEPKAAVDLYQADLIAAQQRLPNRLIVQQTEQKPERSRIAGAGAAAIDAMAAPLPNIQEPGSITSDAVILTGVQLLREDGHATTVIVCGEPAVVELTYQALEELKDPHCGFQIRDRFGAILYGTNSNGMRHKLGALRAGEKITCRFRFPMRIAIGEYTITAGFADGGHDNGSFDRALGFQHGVFSFTVVENIRGRRWAGIADLNAALDFSKIE